MTGSRAWWTSGFSSMTARMVSMVFNRPIAVIAFSSPASADSSTWSGELEVKKQIEWSTMMILKATLRVNTILS